MAKKTKKRIKVLVANLAGKYNLPHAKHEVTNMDADQADELIEAGDAIEYTKEVEAKEKKVAEEAAKKPADETSEEEKEE